jgi:CDP-diacylglycerol--glycerol-3-phosphate 3-phosphatidyltransferase
MSRVRYLAVAPPLVLGSVALIVAPPALAGSLLVAGVLSAELLASLRRHPTPTRVGIANLLTLLRGLLIGALVLYVIGGPLGLPAVGAVLLYGTASAIDAVDGAVARHRAETSAVGADLDQAVDSLGFVLGFVLAPLAAIALGALPVYYLALSAARYVYLAAVRLRRARGLAVAPLPPSRVRRPLAALQMLFITVALAPPVPASVTLTLAPLALAPSLLIFGRDYLVVAGHLRTS